MDKRIVNFLKKHHVLTLATTTPGECTSWCSNLFYVYSEQTNSLVFTSDDATRHAQEFMAMNTVAATVTRQSRVVARLRGVQMTGIVSRADEPMYRKAFLQAFPYAALSLRQMWRMEILHAKFTDNTLGFGSKIIYNKIN